MNVSDRFTIRRFVQYDQQFYERWKAYCQLLGKKEKIEVKDSLSKTEETEHE